ncbi:MAG: glycosyltransferase family 39 protein [Ardenticatenaceae bacterium]|nr:glycosyltransferase family 39 protein [Ardenticatenaceae bacterium]
MKLSVTSRLLTLNSALLVGGFLLALLTVRLHPLLSIEQIRLSYPLLYLGTAISVLAVIKLLNIPLPEWPYQLPSRLADTLSIQPVQLNFLLLAPCYAFLARLAAGDGEIARQWEISLTAWLLAMIAVTLGSYKPSNEPLRRPSWQTQDWLWVALLLIIALLFRATFLTSFPNTLSGDEGSSGLFAIRYLDGSADNLLNLGWFSFPSLYFQVQAWGIALLGQTTTGLRITSAIAGALTVPVLYWLMHQLYGRTAALASSFLLTAAHYHIHFSRIGLNNIWDGLFALLVLATLWRGWRSGQRLWFILCGLILGLSQYFYVSMRPFPLFILLWSGCALWLDRPTFKRRFADLSLTAYISLVVFIPLALYFVAHPDQFNAPMQRVSIFNGWMEVAVAHTGWSETRIIFDQIRKSAFGITHIPLRSWYTPGTGMLLPGMAALFILGLIFALRKIKLQGLLLLVPLTGIIIVGAFSQDLPAAQRYIILSPLCLAFCGLAVGHMIDHLKRTMLDQPAAPSLVLTILLLGLMTYDLNFYFREIPERFTLGGINTRVATTVADYLRPYDRSGFTVYFVGAPRMTYTSHSTLPYLLPQTAGKDILEPLEAPPPLSLDGPTTFVMLPERFTEFKYIKEAFPDGKIEVINDENGHMLFVTYAVVPN